MSIPSDPFIAQMIHDATLAAVAEKNRPIMPIQVSRIVADYIDRVIDEKQRRVYDFFRPLLIDYK